MHTLSGKPMNTNQLTDWLLSNDPAPLAQEDRRFIAQALSELAVAHALIAKQALLLDSFNADHAAIESTLRQSMRQITTDTSSMEATPFDYAAAAQARRDLSAKIDQATSLRAVVALAINAVRAITSG